MIEKQLPIYDGRYTITDDGIVKNTLTNHILNPYLTGGYPSLKLRVDAISRPKTFLVHRLMASMFLKNNENFPVVLHKDNNKLNFQLDNLKWGTYSENNAQAIRDGLNKVPRPDNRVYYCIDHENCPVYIRKHGMKEVSTTLKIENHSTIHNYLHRKTPINLGPFKDWEINQDGK